MVTVTGVANEVDNFVNIGRLVFTTTDPVTKATSTSGVAYDLNIQTPFGLGGANSSVLGIAGEAIEIMGAVFGTASVTSPQAIVSNTSLSGATIAGIVLNLLDTGTSPTQLIMTALNYAYSVQSPAPAGGFLTWEITTLYKNLTGAAPSATQLNYWTNEVNSGNLTPAALGWMAAQATQGGNLTSTQTLLAGVQTTGLQFTPLAHLFD